MKVSALTAAAFVGAASAQANNFIPVLVGQGGNVFSPNKVTANVGDTIQFQFMGGNHTVTQSTFDNPCVPISMSDPSVVGFHSGFFPAAQVSSQGMVLAWNLQINDTRPIWLYCAQGRHCQSGMGLVINENSAANQTRTLETYQAQAAAVPQSMVPAGNIATGGQPTDANGNPTNVDPNANGGNGNAGVALQAPISALLIAVAGAALLL